MKNETRFYKCEKCGNVVGLIVDQGVPIFCCNQKMTHLEAKKEGLRGLTKEELPCIKPLLKQLYLLLPLVILIALVTSGTRSIQYAAAIAIIVAIVGRLPGLLRLGRPGKADGRDGSS